MTSDQPDLEALRRRLYADPSEDATRLYEAALEQGARATTRVEEAVKAAEKTNQVRRRRLVVGCTAALIGLAMCGLLVRFTAEQTARASLLTKAAGSPLFDTCGIVVPRIRLVRNVLAAGVKPSLNDLSWLRGSILTNTYALRMPDRAGVRGVSDGLQQLPLERLGRLHNGEYIRVSVVAIDAAVTWTVTSADGVPWGRCGSTQQGAAATAVLRLRGNPPYSVTVNTQPTARFAYFSEVPEYPMS